MAGGTTVTVSYVSRDGSKVTITGLVGSTLASKPGYTYNLSYKIGAAGTYQTLISQNGPGSSTPDISSATAWTYTVDVGTLDTVYFRLQVTDLNPVTYTGTTLAIIGVGYDKTTTTGRTSNIRAADGSWARAFATRKPHPNR